MIAALLALLPAAVQPSDAPTMRTAFTCEVWEVAGSPPEKTDRSHRLAILLDGAGPYSPHKTLDPASVLEGSEVQQFLVVQNKGDLRLVGLTGNADLPSTWTLVLYQEKSGKVWDIAVARKGQVAHSGFCSGFKKSTTVQDIESFASKWNAGK